MMPNPIICLMGPTASGKTALALQLAKQLPVEIISVDSALVYRGMNKGTAKPTAAELAQVPHHLIDIRNPEEPYSAAEFAKDATLLVAEIQARGCIPLLVGGTMLYFKALQQGLAPLPSADLAVRAALEVDLATYGVEMLHQRLAAIDPESAARIHPHDPQRIQRALEVYQTTGQPLSALYAQQEVLAVKEMVNIGLMPQERSLLHQRIAQRFQAMLDAGFLDEVQQLYKHTALNADLPAMRAVGYRQAWAYLQGEYDLASMQAKAVAATRQLAKRQMTWLRHWPAIQLFDCFAEDLVQQVDDFLRFLVK